LAFPVHYDDQFTIDRAGDKLDILIVNDNSASMREEQKKMAQRFSNFVSGLKDLDWQLSMITTDVRSQGKAWQDGRFLKFIGTNNLNVINQNTPKLDKVFSDTVQRKEIGSSDEQGIKALRRAIARSENKSFFRPHSHLATIVISDEDEHSTGQNLKPDNLPENLIRTITENFGTEKTFANHAIVFNKTSKACPQVGDSARGKTYEKLSQLTGGTISDICAADYNVALQKIGDQIRNKVFTYMLKCVPDQGSLKVTYTPMPPSPIQETVEENRLKLKPYPALGTRVNVSYNCQVQR